MPFLVSRVCAVVLAIHMSKHVFAFNMHGAPIASSASAHECHDEKEAFYGARRVSLLSNCGAICDTANHTGSTFRVGVEDRIDSSGGGSVGESAPYLTKPVDCFAAWRHGDDDDDDDEDDTGSTSSPTVVAWPPPHRPPCPLFGDFTMDFTTPTEAWFEFERSAAPAPPPLPGSNDDDTDADGNGSNDDDDDADDDVGDGPWWEWSSSRIKRLVAMADDRSFHAIAVRSANGYGEWAVEAVAEGIANLGLGDMSSSDSSSSSHACSHACSGACCSNSNACCSSSSSVCSSSSNSSSSSKSGSSSCSCSSGGTAGNSNTASRGGGNNTNDIVVKKRVLVIGSRSPWVESLLLSHRAIATTTTATTTATHDNDKDTDDNEGSHDTDNGDPGGDGHTGGGRNGSGSCGCSCCWGDHGDGGTGDGCGGDCCCCQEGRKKKKEVVVKVEVHVTTMEYAPLKWGGHPRLRTVVPSELKKEFLSGELELFDAVVSYSSVEHSGLGRYGDALNPWGDLVAMAQAWCLTKTGGRLLLAVPLHHHHDVLVFNVHRLYGSSASSSFVGPQGAVSRYSHLTANWRLNWEGEEDVEYGQTARVFTRMATTMEVATTPTTVEMALEKKVPEKEDDDDDYDDNESVRLRNENLNEAAAAAAAALKVKVEALESEVRAAKKELAVYDAAATTADATSTATVATATAATAASEKSNREVARVSKERERTADVHGKFADPVPSENGLECGLHWGMGRSCLYELLSS